MKKARRIVADFFVQGEYDWDESNPRPWFSLLAFDDGAIKVHHSSGGDETIELCDFLSRVEEALGNLNKRERTGYFLSYSVDEDTLVCLLEDLRALIVPCDFCGEEIVGERSYSDPHYHEVWRGEDPATGDSLGSRYLLVCDSCWSRVEEDAVPWDEYTVGSSVPVGGVESEYLIPDSYFLVLKEEKGGKDN